jgi:hypothetical protein
MCPSCAPPPLATPVVFACVQSVGCDIHTVNCTESRSRRTNPCPALAPAPSLWSHHFHSTPPISQCTQGHHHRASFYIVFSLSSCRQARCLDLASLVRHVQEARLAVIPLLMPSPPSPSLLLYAHHHAQLKAHFGLTTISSTTTSTTFKGNSNMRTGTLPTNKITTKTESPRPTRAQYRGRAQE